MPKFLETTRVEAISRLRVTARWDKHETASAVYNPPPGWCVKSVETSVLSSNKGSREVSVVAGGATIVTETMIREIYEKALAVAGQRNDAKLGATLNQRAEAHVQELRRWAASHNTVLAVVRARGSGDFFDRRRGWEEISVFANIIYLGS